MGEVAMVMCMVAKGDLPLDLFWSLNEVPIVSGEGGFTVLKMNSRSSTLSIDSLDGVHRGRYSCVARNKAGFDEFNAELRVNGYLFLNYIKLVICFSLTCFILSSHILKCYRDHILNVCVQKIENIFV